MTLDPKDRQLLLLLQEDSKRTTKSLATALDLSVTAVFERIKKLEKLKVIEKYVALVDRKLIAKDFMVLCHVNSSSTAKNTSRSSNGKSLSSPKYWNAFMSVATTTTS